MGDKAAAANIVQVMNRAGLKRIIGATILGIYNEVPGASGKWNQDMVGMARIRHQKESAEVFEQSDYESVSFPIDIEIDLDI
jgi:hypothetical protein